MNVCRGLDVAEVLLVKIETVDFTLPLMAEDISSHNHFLLADTVQVIEHLISTQTLNHVVADLVRSTKRTALGHHCVLVFLDKCRVAGLALKVAVHVVPYKKSGRIHDGHVFSVQFRQGKGLAFSEVLVERRTHVVKACRVIVVVFRCKFHFFILLLSILLPD